MECWKEERGERKRVAAGREILEIAPHQGPSSTATVWRDLPVAGEDPCSSIGAHLWRTHVIAVEERFRHANEFEVEDNDHHIQSKPHDQVVSVQIQPSLHPDTASMANLSNGLRQIRCRAALPAPQWQPTLALRSSRHEVRRTLTAKADGTSTTSTTAAATPEGPINPTAASLDAVKIPYEGVWHARHVPATPSYFTREPAFNDLYIRLTAMLTKYSHLPTLKGNEAPLQPWMRLEHIRQHMGEPIKASYFAKVIRVAKRLNLIEPSLRPKEVSIVIQQLVRAINPAENRPVPLTLDRFGRAVGTGKRKESTARAFVVEGTGQFLVNGKTLSEMFGRVHDRESAAWALLATQRIDKYNVWALVGGGGVTGQAEALTMAVAKALIAHEPALKPALRKGKALFPRDFLFYHDIANKFNSWLHHERQQDSGEEEAWQSQGPQGSRLGQAIIVTSITSKESLTR